MSTTEIASNAAARISMMMGSGDYSEDCALGRQLAKELLDEARRTNNPTMLSSIVRDLVACGQFGPVQIGFFSVIMINAIT